MNMTSKKPLVSVCIAAYNTERYIRETILSVLAQTYANFELIVIDDGSTDATIAVVSDFEDSRIKCYQNDVNQGVGYTRGRYLDLAQGKYLAVVDADDIWLPTKLEQQVDYLESNPDYIGCGCWGSRFYADGREELWAYPPSDSEVRYRLLWGSSVIHSSLIFNLTIARRHGCDYDASMQQAEDYDLLRQLVRVGEFANLNEVLVRYRMHENQLTETGKAVQVTNSYQIGLKYLRDLGIDLSGAQGGAYEEVYRYRYDLGIAGLLDFSRMISACSDKMPFARDLLDRKLAAVCGASVRNGFEVVQIYVRYSQVATFSRLCRTSRIFLKFVYLKLPFKD